MVALGRAWAAIARLAEISACLQRARWQVAARTTRALGKFAHIRRDVHHQPVPEARASRRVGVVAGDGEAFRPTWRARPLEMWRLVAPSAAKAEIGRQDEFVREIVAVLEAVANHPECHVAVSFGSPRSAGRIGP